MNMADFKDDICDAHILPIENRIRQMWPGQEPKITLMIRTPWLPDGGILITNDSASEAKAEIERLFGKDIVA